MQRQRLTGSRKEAAHQACPEICQTVAAMTSGQSYYQLASVVAMGNADIFPLTSASRQVGHSSRCIEVMPYGVPEAKRGRDPSPVLMRASRQKIRDGRKDCRCPKFPRVSRGASMPLQLNTKVLQCATWDCLFSFVSMVTLRWVLL